MIAVVVATELPDNSDIDSMVQDPLVSHVLLMVFRDLVRDHSNLTAIVVPRFPQRRYRACEHHPGSPKSPG